MRKLSLLIPLLLLAGCVVNPAASPTSAANPTNLPSPTYYQPPASTPTPGYTPIMITFTPAPELNPTQLVGTLEAALRPDQFSRMQSPDGKWTAEYSRADCYSALGPLQDTVFYERLRVLDGNGQEKWLISREAGRCGLGMGYYAMLDWSYDSHYFYYTFSVVPDGATCFTDSYRTIFQLDVETGKTTALPGYGPLAPGGQLLAWRDLQDLVLWPLDGSQPIRHPGVFPEDPTLQLGWTTNGQSIIAVQNTSECFPLQTPSVLKIDMPTGLVQKIYQGDVNSPQLTGYAGEVAGKLIFSDITGAFWSLDPASGILNPTSGLELTPSPTPAGQLPTSMKGYELYSWQVEKVWNFTLITGTNRNKTAEEIMAQGDVQTRDGWVKITVAGTDNLETLLARLPKGENVYWMDGQAAPGMFAKPPAEMIDVIQQYCRQIGVNLYVSR